MNKKAAAIEKTAGRAEAQRDRILDAAKKCFIEHGFHAAGMALISETAGMSAGLIYRYFPSKNAIILAIIQQQVEESRLTIRGLYGAPDFAVAAFEAFTKWRDANAEIMNAALFLEMSAEASRDPELALALKASDVALRSEVSKWLATDIEQGGEGLAAEVAKVRALTLQCFMEGLAIRALREPDLDEKTLKGSLRQFVDDLLTSR